MDPTSPSRQSQHEHLRQSSCQYGSKAFSRYLSAIFFLQAWHVFSIGDEGAVGRVGGDVVEVAAGWVTVPVESSGDSCIVRSENRT